MCGTVKGVVYESLGPYEGVVQWHTNCICISGLLQTVMFTLYGNQYEDREEQLLLNMFEVHSVCATTHGNWHVLLTSWFIGMFC